LIYGRLTAEDYEDNVASDPRIDALRDKISCVEDPQITLDYHDPAKRTIGNGLTVTLNDGITLDEVFIDIPVGHKFRREEVILLISNLTYPGPALAPRQIPTTFRSPLYTNRERRNPESK